MKTVAFTIFIIVAAISAILFIVALVIKCRKPHVEVKIRTPVKVEQIE